MGPKSRHRTKTPAGISNFGTLPSNSTSSIGMGKKASIAKSNLYSNLLPILNQNHLGSKARNQNHKSFNQNAKNQVGWLEWSTSFLFPSSAASSSSDPERKVIAHWDPLTNLVYVPTHELELARKLLWQRGFFGKGNLSRSEPTWKEREQGKEKVRRVREKGGVAYTPEELTALRRKERQAAKIERARLAVRAGTQLPDGIVALGGELQEGDLPSSLQGLQSSTGAQIGDTYGEHIPGLIYFKPPTKPLAPAGMDQDQSQTQEGDEEDIMSLEVEQLERFVLSREETFFLAGMMDCLEVRDQNDVPLSLSSLYALLLHSSLPLSIRGFSHLSLQSEPSEFTSSVKSLENSWARPDNPFLLHYIAYHHFRSLGWVVRSGSKFCVDWLLYKKGPVFGHAEFAVLVIPVYSDPRDEQSSPFSKHPSSGERSWVWFSSMNRVNSQVQKTLILCHVHIPPLSSLPSSSLSTPEEFVKNLSEGKSFEVREVAIRRWVPARMRG